MSLRALITPKTPISPIKIKDLKALNGLKVLNVQLRYPLYFFELALGGSADGALPSVGQLLKRGVGRDATFGVAHRGIVGVGALFALVAFVLFG